MKKEYHILNGDSLKAIFPQRLGGEIIVMRECLVDGNVEGKDLAGFLETRAHFISSNYEGFTKQDYYLKTVPELEKILDIQDQANINLWFEEDLFCQVNLWFVLNLLKNKIQNNHFFLIKPKAHNPYAFGSLDKSELIAEYENRIELSHFDKLAKLWNYYQMNETQKLFDISKELESIYPFIYKAVEAHIERIPTKGNIGRPGQSLIQIIKDLGTNEFDPVFQEFCKREAIYGFGDVQVKRLYNEILKTL